MDLKEGQQMPWPVKSFEVQGRECLAVMDGCALFRVPVNHRLPGIPVDAAIKLNLQLSAIGDCRLVVINEQKSKELCQWMIQQIEERLDEQLLFEHEDTSQDLIILLQKLHEQLERQTQTRRNCHVPLGSKSVNQLFQYLEQTEVLASSNNLDQRNLSDDLARCIAAIKGRSLADSFSPKGQSSTPRFRLQQLLERNELIGRDVIISEDKLQQNCGDLIAFSEEEEATPALLQSKRGGYWLWMPSKMSKPAPIHTCKPLLGELSPRMVAITPALSQKDLSTLGLLQFAFGESIGIINYIVGGLLIGLACGFLLSIGREVGAARWIFSLAGSGAFLGGFLGVLNGGFRSGVAVMILATLMAMLTPAFNTAITNQALPDRDLGLLLQVSMLLFAAGVTRVGLEWVQSRDVLLTQHSGAAKTQLAGMQRVLSLPTDFFRQRSVGELQLRFGALEELRKEIQILMEGGLVKLMLTSLFILFMLRISVKLTLLAIVIAVLIVLPTAIMALQSRPLQRHQEVAEAAAQSRNLELISSVSKLRLAGAEAAAARWWAQRFQQVIALEDSLDAKQATAKLLKAVMPNLGTLLIYILMTKLIAEAAASASLNAPNIGQQLGFFAAFSTFIGGIAGLAGLLAGAFDLPVIYERARPILDATTEAQDDHEEAGQLRGDVQLDRVRYRYANDLPLVLDGVSLEAKAGQFVAIVGPSGSGKSTLVRLMLGFATPEDGTIRLDGRSLSGLELRSVRRQIGTVLQSNSLFSGSLMEAIAGGAVIQEDEAWHAAELAGLADDIREMPMGMQTVIPDGGGTLSGGQCQRIAIARALVRQPKLLIFDEATSALDNHTQAIVTQSLDQLSITRLVIAHRLSTIRHADQIIVMDQGQVQEQGNFDNLMRNQGLFARLMERQIQ